MRILLASLVALSLFPAGCGTTTAPAPTTTSTPAATTNPASSAAATINVDASTSSGGAASVLAISAAPAAPPLPPAAPITAAATVDTPVCLGFMPSGRAAYILTTNYDKWIPEWFIRVESVGAAGSPDLTMMVKTRSRDVAKRRFDALVKPINALIRDYKLVACTTTKAGPDQTLEVTVLGTRTTISYIEGQLVIAPEGKPRVLRPQTEVDDLSLVAAYTVPTLPLVAVVLRDTGESVAMNDRTEWIMLDSPAEIAQ